MNKVIVISSEPVARKMTGPGVRYWQMAQELAKYFEVVLFAPNGQEGEAPFVVQQSSRSHIQEALKGATVVVLQGLALWEHGYLKKAGVPLVVDLYCPFHLENLEACARSGADAALYEQSLAVLEEQLCYGDFFLCASEKQKDYWLGMLTTLRRVNLQEYHQDPSLRRLLRVVPFGLPAQKPRKTGAVLKGVLPGIGLEDKVVLWAGGIWDWLDPLTAIAAMRQLSQRRSDVKLVFLGGGGLPGSGEEKPMLTKAKELSRTWQLTGKFVFFHDWVAYDERQNYLLEADAGISLHFEQLETRFSFRTRILDHIWCALPTVMTEGDVMSEFMERRGLGIVVPPEDSQRVAAALEKLLTTASEADEFAQAASAMTWDKVLEPLVSFCREPGVAVGKGQGAVRPATSKAGYYWQKGLALLRRGEWRKLWLKCRHLVRMRR